MRTAGRLLVVLLLVGCSENRDAGPVASDASAGSDLPLAPATSAAARMYGLQVGARWTYRRSGGMVEPRSANSQSLPGGNLRWKEITACEAAPLFDDAAQPLGAVQSYVRENRSVTGTTSVHYLVAASEGVLRVRRDDVDLGNLTMAAVYAPPSPRLLNGPYTLGRRWAFDLRTAEFEWPRTSNPRVLEFRGANNTSAEDVVIEPRPAGRDRGDVPHGGRGPAVGGKQRAQGAELLFGRTRRSGRGDHLASDAPADHPGRGARLVHARIRQLCRFGGARRGALRLSASRL